MTWPVASARHTVPFMIHWGDVPTWCLVGLGAIGGGAALVTLWLQRVQLRDQQDVIRRQTEALERQQADLVDVSGRPTDGAQATVLPEDKGEPVHMVVVTNGSKRPVREVTVKIEAIQHDESIRHQKLADVWGTLQTYTTHAVDALSGAPVQGIAQRFVLGERSPTMPVLRAGQTAGFVWGFTAALYPRVISRVRFTDDAGLHWEIDTSLSLKRLKTRDW